MGNPDGSWLLLVRIFHRGTGLPGIDAGDLAELVQLSHHVDAWFEPRLRV
jgi:hypothetical protein